VWHRTQKLRPVAGGGVRLTFDAGNLTQVVPWVLSWGPHARAAEPPELVENVTKALNETMKLYSAG
jgi:predicted DNA-binding transcriptional regulator YafY